MSKDQNESEKKSVTTEPGEPGRTPGSAEGPRETVEEDLREREKKDESEDGRQS